MRSLALIAIVAAILVPPARAGATDFVPSGPDALPRLLGPDAFDDVDHSEVARTVEKQGFWAGDPIGISQCASCHADAAAQWASSAHRFASFNNPYYAAAVDQFRKNRSNVASRFCAGCHDPALVSSGRIDATIERRTREAQAGIVCLTCHSITEHPRTGNGGFTAVLAPWPTRGEGHRARLRPATMATVDFCGTCHRVGLTHEVTGDRWLRGQDELFAWNASSIAGNGAAAIHRAPATQRCQDCHMPYEAATRGDAGAKLGPDGKPRIRSHRFLGANTALPHLRGDGETEARIVAFLQDRVSLSLELADGDLLDVVLRSKGIGHRFPGGTMDSNEVWLAIEARDASGRLVGESGSLRERDGQLVLGKEAHLVRAQMVDGDGVPLRFRDVEHARGVVYDNSLAPGDPSAVRYALPAGTVRVEAKLYYRKLSAEYTRYACKEVPDPVVRKRCETLPPVELAHATIDRPSTLPPVEERCRTLPWDRVLDHGIALAGALAERVEDATPWLRCAAERAPGRVEPVLGMMRVAVALGQTDEVVKLAARAVKLAPAHPGAHYLATVALLKAYRHRAARREAERLAQQLPNDLVALSLLARARGLDHDPRAALAAADKLLTIDPDHEDGHYQRALALREVGRRDEADKEEAEYLVHRTAVEVNLALRAGYRRWLGQPHDETEPLHVHALVARGENERASLTP